MDRECRIKYVPIPSDILDDLCCRFIVNVPSQEKKDLIRICFQIEQAHWFYLDFYSKNNETAKPCTFKEFTRNIFCHISYLRPFLNDLEFIIDEFKEYKYSVPTFGAIIIDEYFTHVLVVKSYWSKASWGFPKGKINKDELPHHCAAREVLEETGYDIHPKLDPNAFVDATIRDQCIRLYVIPGVSRTTKFHPQTRHEIKEIKWVSLSSIPVRRAKPKNKLEYIKNKNFYMVIPFMRDLRRWISENAPPNVITRTKSRPFCNADEMLRLTMIATANGYSQIDEHVFDDEIECYGGEIDEDDVKTSYGDEEIYGIPKIKSYFNGEWTTRLDMSTIKRNKIKINPETIFEDACDRSLYEDVYYDCDETKIAIKDEKPELKKPGVSENYVDDIERQILSSIEKNAMMEEHENAKNAAYSLIASINSTTSSAKPQKKSRRTVSFIGNNVSGNSSSKPESESKPDFETKHYVKSKHDVESKPDFETKHYVKSKHDVESKPDFETKHYVKSKHDVESKPNFETKHCVKSKHDVEFKPDFESEHNVESKTSVKSKSEFKPDIKTETDTTLENEIMVDKSHKMDLLTDVFLKNPIFNKEEFLKKLSENKAIQAMKNFKMNREKLLKILE